MDQPDWLAGPQAKVDRALNHLNALEAECRLFLDAEPKPFRVVAQFETEAGCHVTRVRFGKAVPLVLSVVVGEFFHDLRSALEHVAWVLACRANRVDDLWKPGVRERITFPVCKTREHFQRHSLMPLIGRDAKAILAPLQPYHGRDRTEAANHRLVHLNEFWNIDKHRIVHGGIAAIDLSTVSFVPMAIRLDEFSGDVNVEYIPVEPPLEDGTPIARIRFGQMKEAGTTKVDVKGQPTAQLAFGAGGEYATIPVLASFCAYVLDVIESVRPLF